MKGICTIDDSGKVLTCQGALIAAAVCRQDCITQHEINTGHKVVV